jgi:hypothetical protein
MLLAGALPSGRTCVRCNRDTGDVIRVLAVCERAWVRRRGGFSWGLLVLALFSPLVRLWLLLHRPEEKEYGRDKVYSLPLRVCPDCRPALRRTREMRQWLRRVPEYDSLLDKFPNAQVSLVT